MTEHPMPRAERYLSRALPVAGTLLLALLLPGCASPYYEITDPTTGKVYYTGSDIATRYPESGAIRFEDAITGRIVTLASHEIRPLTKAQFNAAVKESAIPLEDDAPAADPRP